MYDLASTFKFAAKDGLYNNTVLLGMYNMRAVTAFTKHISNMHNIKFPNSLPYSNALVISALTPDAALHCASHHNPQLCVNSSSYGFDDLTSGWFERPLLWRAMGIIRVLMIQAAVRSGFNCFFIDTDIIVLAELTAHFQLFFQDIVVSGDQCRAVTLDARRTVQPFEDTPAKGTKLNIGLLYARPTYGSILLLDTWLRSMHDAFQQKQRDPWDQLMFQQSYLDLTRAGLPVTVGLLDSVHFPTGCESGGCGCDVAGTLIDRTCPLSAVGLWLTNHAACIPPRKKDQYIEACIEMYSLAKNAWVKHESPVIKMPDNTAIFDVAVLYDHGTLHMWSSVRAQKSIGYSRSQDGITWSPLSIVMVPSGSSWQHNINRITVITSPDDPQVLLMWWTGQNFETQRSSIGMASSHDGGLSWRQLNGGNPVLQPTEDWEMTNVMCPHVLWDKQLGVFRIWYSAGEFNEPNAIGYATSVDGIVWEKPHATPIFSALGTAHEHHKVAGCQVLQFGGWHVMFYICYESETLARICVARSRDGITHWIRSIANPIIQPTTGTWDEEATYKPFVVRRMNQSMFLFYNGRKGEQESIGVATWPLGDKDLLDSMPET